MANHLTIVTSVYQGRTALKVLRRSQVSAMLVTCVLVVMRFQIQLDPSHSTIMTTQAHAQLGTTAQLVQVSPTLAKQENISQTRNSQLVSLVQPANTVPRRDLLCQQALVLTGTTAESAQCLLNHQTTSWDDCVRLETTV
jgi:hypothetical protein